MSHSAKPSLAQYTTLRVGGAAEQLVTAHTMAELVAAARSAERSRRPWLVLGGGSNVLFSDAGYSGTVILNRVSGWEYQSGGDGVVYATAAAGTELDAFIADTVARGYWGLENLSHIPGSVGATPIQNVGAYGVEVSDRIEYVTIYDAASDTQYQLPAAECGFGYRHSRFKESSEKTSVVLSVTFRLQSAPRPIISYRDVAERFASVPPEAITQAAIRDAVIDIRAKKFPDWHQVGTAGSFFKNPIVSADMYANLKARYPELPAHELAQGQYKLSLGWMLDKICGLRGQCNDGGTVCLSAAQALVLTNQGDSAAAIVHYAAHVTKLVQQATDVTIYPEVTIVSDSMNRNSKNS